MRGEQVHALIHELVGIGHALVVRIVDHETTQLDERITRGALISLGRRRGHEPAAGDLVEVGLGDSEPGVGDLFV